MENSKFKALVIGATGATGREVLKSLMESDKWSTVSVIVRRKLPEWEKYDSTKLKIYEVQSLDELENTEKWKDFQNYDTYFSCLGARSNDTKPNLYKIEYTYAYNAGLIAKKFNFVHCSYIGGSGMKKGSWLYHADVKATVCEDLQKLNFPIFSLFNPGFLIDRDNDKRFFDGVYKYIPFVPKIKTAELGKSMVKEAEIVLLKARTDPVIHRYSNSEIKAFLKL